MTGPVKPTRRSDEIRRRREQRSHLEHVSQAARAGRVAGADLPTRPERRPSLLDRLKTGPSQPANGKRAATRAQTRPVLPDKSTSLTSRLTGGLAGRRLPVRNRWDQETISPPVMRRGGASALATIKTTKRGRSGARRMYNVPLNRHGAEMRLPSLPRVRVGWRVLSFLLLAALGATLYFAWTSPVYTVEAAQINGLQRLTSGEVNRELALAGMPIFAIDKGEIQATLEDRFPEISSTEIAVALPNTVVITVTERVPSLIWRQEGQAYLVDAQGMIFPARGEIQEGSLPMIEAAANPPYVAPITAQDVEAVSLINHEQGLGTGDEDLTGDGQSENPARALMSPEMVKALLLMWEQAPDGAVLMYDPTHGFGWQDRRGWMVYFGNFKDMTLKLEVYRAILDHLKSIGARPEWISIEHLGAPHYRLEPGQ